MAAAIRQLRRDQDSILRLFIFSLICFVFSSFSVVIVSGRRGKASLKLQTTLAFAAVAMAVVAFRSISLFYHKR